MKSINYIVKEWTNWHGGQYTPPNVMSISNIVVVYRLCGILDVNYGGYLRWTHIKPNKVGHYSNILKYIVVNKESVFIPIKSNDVVDCTQFNNCSGIITVDRVDDMKIQGINNTLYGTEYKHYVPFSHIHNKGILFECMPTMSYIEETILAPEELPI